ncbi:MAG: UvrD-helicase domain-containing protein [Butyrivibrio sp.]|nr:UvrD-helicase domain-containing protein [Butyrivibrio sp.]
MGIYDTLNTEQKKAVLQTDGPVLILAGAGSGKTRVLTHRVAFLIDECGVNPWNIMAITFTNKAAGEMRERVDKIVGFGAESIWVATFHSTCVRILRRYADRLGYKNNFTIYDTDDSKSLMKDICKKYQLETVRLKMKRIMSTISSCKDNLVTPDEYYLANGGDSEKLKISKAYTEYQNALKNNNAMDFDDLIFNTVMLFKKNQDVLESYQERFKYIMVDEYQDTNNAQFELIRLLADKYKNLCVVGDDDQSIYRFRGANIRNILDFEKVYKDAEVIKLEQNYRSTQNILDAANSVIKNNFGRKDKALWTDEGKGDKVRLCEFDQAPDEASFIADDIGKLHRNGKIKYKDVAVLYRTNAQSRLIEEKFVLNGIPYDLVGGTNFYSRREIKDLLCYLKTIDNAVDDLAVRRIINVPRRGIGQTTINNVQEYADERQISFYDALCEVDNIVSVTRATTKLKDFVVMIRAFRAKEKEMSLSDLLKDIIVTTNYIDYIKAETEDDESGDNDRVQNIDELVSKLAAYEESTDDPSLSGFLEEVALVADIDNVSEDDDKVLLMTLHSAKGLEFEHVYLAGMEDGVFPSYMSIEAEDYDPEAIEEERRLAYVGITRAKKELTLTRAKRRMVRGEFQSNPLSRFVREIPGNLLERSATESAPSFLFDDGDSIDEFDDIDLSSGNMYRRSTTASSSYSTGYNGYDKPGREPMYQAKGSSIYGIGKPKETGDSSAASFGTGRPKAKLRPEPKRAVPDKPFIMGASSNHAAASKGKSLGLQKGMPAAAGTEPDYKVGDRVKHIKFGVGTVVGLEKETRDYKVSVEFDECGPKVMFAAFAKLKKV